MIQDILGLTAAVTAAAQTGLLEGLVVAAPRTSADHATANQLDLRATERVLDVLVAYGLAVREGSAIGGSPELRALVHAPGGIQNATAMWSHVPAFLRTGTPYLRMDSGREAAYQGVVASLGKMFTAAATELAALLDRAPRHILDIGCGSGVWSVAIAERFTDARVTGLDLPAVLDAFKARATERGVGDRIATLPGDVHEVTIPQSFDLVIIANVLRIESPDRARAIVQRAAAAIVPGGDLLIVDALSSGTPARDQARSVYALHLSMRTDHGRVYSPADVTAWMRDAGIDAPRMFDLEQRPGAVGALLGRKRD